MTKNRPDPQAAALMAGIKARSAGIVIIGMGYVGLPLAITLHAAGFPVTGFDLDEARVAALNAGRSYIRSIGHDSVAELAASERFSASGDEAVLDRADIIIICVPTPLDMHRSPDMSYVEASSRLVGEHLKAGQLVCFESTTYPGTSSDLVVPLLEASGLKAGTDFHYVYSPEREDPGNASFGTSTIPRVIGADDPVSLELGKALYGSAIGEIVPVANSRTAEAVKLTENIYRAVNIALVNELKIIFDRMDIDIWDVVEAAKTKPFGFTPFYPGPGLGGHCIPVDPFYLTWKAREHGLPTHFIELAGEINRHMPHYVVDKILRALNDHARLALRGAKVLILGVAYKKNVDDMRESPAVELIRLLADGGAELSYHDPHIPELGAAALPKGVGPMQSSALSPENLVEYDLAVVVTDHDQTDWQMIADHVPLVVDTRNVMIRFPGSARVVKA